MIGFHLMVLTDESQKCALQVQVVLHMLIIEGVCFKIIRASNHGTYTNYQSQQQPNKNRCDIW